MLLYIHKIMSFKKKILILGITSFSGSTLAQFLEKKDFKIIGTYGRKKNKIYNLFSNKLQTHQIDLVKNFNKLKNLINRFKPDIIIDFASICMVNESWNNKDYYYDVNVKSKIKIANFLKKKKFLKKYIYISTPEIFGENNNIDEKCNKYNPKTPYAETKMIAEMIFKSAFITNKFPIIIARFSNFFGPGQPEYRLIPKIILNIKKDKKFPLHGRGLSRRNFIYSSDFSSGIFKVIKFGKLGKIYHFSGNSLLSVREVIKKICNIFKIKFNSFIINAKERKNEDSIYFLKSNYTRKKLNWKPKAKFDESLLKTIDYYIKNEILFSKKKLIYQNNNLKK